MNFPWQEEYFIARVLLGFSEEEFWKSSPRKIYTLKHLYDKYFGLSKNKNNHQVQIQEILSILGQEPRK